MAQGTQEEENLSSSEVGDDRSFLGVPSHHTGGA